MRRLLIRLGRACLLRCPHCGAGRVTRRWIQVRDACPRCGLRMDRGERGYWTGAMALNLITAEGIFAVGLLITLARTMPDPPWDALLWGSVAAMVLCPVVTYPFSRLVWLAADLTIRPLEPRDFQPVSASPQG
jgi:uncharacterized protein (DUF983 family)